MDEESIITLTSDVVSAFVSNNTVSATDLPNVIKSVFTALSGAGQPAAVVEEAREPAVSIRASVKPDSISCLECGAKFKMLKRHLMVDHNLTPAQYRERWNLKSDYPMVSEEYSQRRKELAVKIGLGRKPGTRMKPTTKKPTRAKKAPAPAPAAAPVTTAAE